MATALVLSRSALEQHLRCPLCFYLQRKLGLAPPSTIPLTLASATDALLKNEYDNVRGTGGNHPLWEREGLRVRAFQHPDFENWRQNFKGMRVLHQATGAVITGAIDDVWQDVDTGELHIVDYKSTSKQGEPSLEGGFGDSYKRQMEIYQWLFRQAGHRVSSIGYFLYVNGQKTGLFYEQGTEGRMRFRTSLIPYVGDDGWVSHAIQDAVACLASSTQPTPSKDCDNCRYFEQRIALVTG